MGIDYTFPGGQLLYASYNRGFRAPGFNAQAFFDPAELSVSRSETVNSWEAGLKTKLFDNHATLDLSGFYYDYRDQQYLDVNPLTAAQQLRNLPRARILGGELELRVRPQPGLSLNLALGLLDTRVLEGSLKGGSIIGSHLPQSPELTINAGFDARLLQGSAGRVNLSANVTYTSSEYFELVNVPRLKQDPYVVASAQLRWESADSRFHASAWVKNLTNSFYYTVRGDLMSGFGFDYNHISAPRTYGVSAGIEF